MALYVCVCWGVPGEVVPAHPITHAGTPSLFLKK